MLTLTATKDSNLAFSMIHLTVPFDQKDIVMNVTTPLIPNEKFKVIGMIMYNQSQFYILIQLRQLGELQPKWCLFK